MTNDPRIPLREFKGRLKRHRVDENETMSKLIVDLAFPHFRGRDMRDEQCIRMYDMFYGPKGAHLLPNASPRRRFSGDSLAPTRLPRGRYFSLARPYPPGYSEDKTLTDNDNGVVRDELAAYANHRAAGPVVVLDVHDKTDRALLRNFGFLSDDEPQKPAFRVIFYRKKGAKSIFDLILTESRREKSWKWDDWGGIVRYTRIDASPFKTSFLSAEQGFVDIAQSFDLYYGFEDVSIDKVVDLRYPDTQHEFVRLFCPEATDARPDIGAVGGFLAILPQLVSPELGGTANTDAIGAYLRSVGVQALIYPSARCNAFVAFRDNELVSYHGWNLVDFRGAAIDGVSEMPKMSFAENRRDIRVEAPPASSGAYYGSWRVLGATEREAKRFEDEVAAYFSGTVA